VTAFPSSINVAATFDKDLMEEHGSLLGKEFRDNGAHVGVDVFGMKSELIRLPC
jgi:beta-glucosidase-like glycosyl hydrolase